MAFGQCGKLGLLIFDRPWCECDKPKHDQVRDRKDAEQAPPAAESKPLQDFPSWENDDEARNQDNEPMRKAEGTHVISPKCWSGNSRGCHERIVACQVAALLARTHPQSASSSFWLDATA